MTHLYPTIDQIIPSYTSVFNFLSVGNNIWGVGEGGRGNWKERSIFFEAVPQSVISFRVLRQYYYTKCKALSIWFSLCQINILGLKKFQVTSVQPS